MDFRNKYLLTTLRVIFGLFMLFSGVSGLLAGESMEGVPEGMQPTLQMLYDTGLFHMIKITETIAGLMLLVGFLPWLAALALAPLGVGIIVFNANVAPQFVISGVIVCLFLAYLGYAYWPKYKPLFEVKK